MGRVLRYAGKGGRVCLDKGGELLVSWKGTTRATEE